LPEAADRGTGDYGLCDPPAFRRRITIFRFYPRLQTHRAREQCFPGPFFLLPSGIKARSARTLEPRSLRQSNPLCSFVPLVVKSFFRASARSAHALTIDDPTS